MSAPNERVDLAALKRPRLGGKEPTRLSHQPKALGEVEWVALRIPIEAASVDAFVAQIKRMDMEEIGATACLEMAG